MLNWTNVKTPLLSLARKTVHSDLEMSNPFHWTVGQSLQTVRESKKKTLIFLWIALGITWLQLDGLTDDDGDLTPNTHFLLSFSLYVDFHYLTVNLLLSPMIKLYFFIRSFFFFSLFLFELNFISIYFDFCVWTNKTLLRKLQSNKTKNYFLSEISLRQV